MRSYRPAQWAWRACWLAAGLVAVGFLVVFFAAPAVNLVAQGFTDENGRPTLSVMAQTFASARTWRIIRFTIGQATLGTLICLLLGLFGAHLLYRVSWPGRTIVRGLVSVPFVLPTVVVGVAFRTLLAANGRLGFLGLDGSWQAITAALVFFNYSVVVRTVGSTWAQLDPRRADAARALGAGPVRVWCTVTLPALAPAIASAAAVVFLFCASAFGVVLVLGGTRYSTLETEIYTQTVEFLDLPAASTLAIVQLAVTGTCLFLSGRAQQRLQRSLGNASPGPLKFSGRRDGLPVAVTAAVILVLLMAPILTLVERSFQVGDSWSLANYRALLATGEDSGMATSVWQTLVNSLTTAVWATMLAVGLGAVVALLLSRRPRSRWGRAGLSIGDAAFMLPLGVSAVTVGFGFLITLDRPPLDLRSSAVLVPIAQAMVAIPLVIRVLLPAVRGIDPRQQEAAAALGAAPWRVLGTVDLPVLARGLGLAVGFAFSTSLGEFGATSFLARPDHMTLPVAIGRLISRPGEANYGMAMASSVLLAAMTVIVMSIAERLRPPEVTSW
ncbi:ABC transporter permease [Acidipropionibacterium jensenii]|uniref:ABC transporter permease n=1 Tax=Acidipropionibacterium jensenii TaxID=1749 RepID=UPI00214B6F7D|nr:iron ABC transporter permease [Acidipropionibacterium jensenii]